MDILETVDQVEQTRALLEYMGYRRVLKLDNLLDGYEEYDAVVDIFSRTFDLEVHTMLCNLAVFEDTYDWAKSAMRAHAKSGQLAEAYSVVWG